MVPEIEGTTEENDEMTLTVTSNRNGNQASRSNFSAAERCTYRIERDGENVGHIEYRPSYPLSAIKPHWNGRGAWVAYIDGAEVAADQNFRRLRAAVLAG